MSRPSDSEDTKDDGKPHKTWDFTINNFTDEDCNWVTRTSTDVSRIVVSKEVGDSGTPHLQGRVTFKRAYRMSGLKKLHPSAHWEVTKCPQDSLYCMKVGGELVVDIDNRKSRGKPQLVRQVPVIEEQSFYLWQKALHEELKKDPDDTTINWVWNAKGGNGKTAFAKWAIVTKRLGEAIIVGNRANDAKYAITQMVANNRPPRVVFINLTRGRCPSYEALEAIKDGMFFSAKYESDMVVFETPHIVVFSNEEPDYEKLSMHRWNVIHIDN